jgi:hypothetical protein
MQDGVVGVLLSLSLVGCLSLGPGSAGTRSCAQLGWVCAADDTGVSCGSCVAPQACSVGSCIDPGAQVIASGATAFAVAGGYSGVLFTLPAAATVRFNASSPGLFQAGVFTLSDWTLFASGPGLRRLRADQPLALRNRGAPPRGGHVHPRVPLRERRGLVPHPLRHQRDLLRAHAPDGLAPDGRAR